MKTFHPNERPAWYPRRILPLAPQISAGPYANGQAIPLPRRVPSPIASLARLPEQSGDDPEPTYCFFPITKFRILPRQLQYCLAIPPCQMSVATLATSRVERMEECIAC